MKRPIEEITSNSTRVPTPTFYREDGKRLKLES
jgi:hypothetical protein